MAAGSAAATPAPPHGTLTSAEYKQLSQVLSSFSRLQKSRHFSWKLVIAACRQVSGSTPLLETQRRSCLDDTDTLEALTNFTTAEPRCIAAAGTSSTGTTTTPTGTTTTGTTTTGTTTTGTTTTGTTTTGTTTTGTGTTTTGLPTGRALRELICLNPEYQALGRAAAVMYPTDVAARRQAIRRGFKGRCLDTLVATPKQIRGEEQFAFSSKHLAADVELLTEVSRGQAPASNISAVQLEDDAAGFEDASRAFLSSNGPQKLSVCPHLVGQ